jgi:hypothetical protein
MPRRIDGVAMKAQISGTFGLLMALLPITWIIAFYLYVWRLATLIGSWPVPMITPDAPKSPDATYSVLSAVVNGLLLPAGLSVIAMPFWLAIAWDRVWPKKAPLYLVPFGIGIAAILVMWSCDPDRAIAWFID